METKSKPTKEEIIVASNKTNDVEEGQKGRDDVSNTDPPSVTEATDTDPQHHTTPRKSLSSSRGASSRKKVMYVFAATLCTAVLVGIATALGLLLPKILNNNDEDDGSEDSSDGDSSKPLGENPSSSVITFNYTSLDNADDRSGNFYSDSFANALNDDVTDVLQGGSVLAWKQLPEAEDSRHRIVIDLQEPQPISEVNITGIVLDRWGLKAPISLRLQIKERKGVAPFFDGLVNVSVPTGDSLGAQSWVERFNIPNDKENITVSQAFLDVTCPQGPERVDSLNMKCGISEVDLM